MTANLSIGCVVAGRYRIVRALGSGGMGEVYLASHELIGRRVAIKVVDAMLAANSEVKERLFAEARAASASGHPNIVEIFDAGELDDGRPFIVMEYLEGHDVWQEVSSGPLPLARACWIVREIALALEAAHRSGVVHRDLKPENVYVVESSIGDRIKVLDFGIAFGGGPLGSRLTRPGVSMGTPAYMAPEQSFGSAPRPTLDIYAMGVMLFELLVGKPPFDAPDPLDIVRRKISESAPSLAERRPEVPAPVAELVDACLRTDPRHRPSSAREIAEALRRFASPRETTDDPRPTFALRSDSSDAHELAPPSGSRPVATRKLDDRTTTTRSRSWIPGVLVAATALVVAAGLILDADGPALSSRDGLIVPRVDVARPDPALSRPRLALRPSVAPPVESVPIPASKVSRPRPDLPDHCDRAVRGAAQARTVHDWPGVLRHTRDSRCFGDVAQRIELRVKAFSELDRLDECIELGKGRREPAIVKLVALCTRRQSR